MQEEGGYQMFKQPDVTRNTNSNWLYSLRDRYRIRLKNAPYEFGVNENVDHDYFKMRPVRYPDRPTELDLLIEKYYAWDGATKMPIFLQTYDLILPTLIHDIFCQATNEGLLKWDPWRKYGDKQFKYLYCETKKYSGENYIIRANILYGAVRLNSIFQGLRRN